jgi:hypothetical protein
LRLNFMDMINNLLFICACLCVLVVVLL